MNIQINGQWFEQNQKKLNETSNIDKALAVSQLRQYVIDNLRDRTAFGAHSIDALGCDPVDHYLQTAWEKLYYGIWEWKEGRTLADQLQRIASSLMQKQVKKWRNREEGKSKMEDVWGRLVDLDVERMDMIDEDNPLDDAYDLMLEVVKDKPEQVEYVLEVKKGGDYDEIAEAMGLKVAEVRLIERRVLRRLRASRS